MRFPCIIALFSLASILTNIDALGAVILKYDFNGNVLDSSGNGNHGTLYGNPNYDLSSKDQGLYFMNPAGPSAGTQYVEIPNSASILGLSNSSFTIAILYKSLDNSMQNGRLFGQWESSGSVSALTDLYNAHGTPGAYAYIKDSVGRILSTKPQAVSDTRTITTDGSYKWTITVLDREQKQLRYYVDDHLITTQSYTTFDSVSFADLRIGMINFDTSYAARLTLVDEFRIYNMPLTSNDIQGIVSSVPEPGSAMSVFCGLAIFIFKKSSRKKATTRV